MSQLFPSPSVILSWPHTSRHAKFLVRSYLSCMNILKKSFVILAQAMRTAILKKNDRFLFFCPRYLDLIISQHRQNDPSQILSCQNIVKMATTTENILGPSSGWKNYWLRRWFELSAWLNTTDWRTHAHMTYFCETSHNRSFKDTGTKMWNPLFFCYAELF